VIQKLKISLFWKKLIEGCFFLCVKSIYDCSTLQYASNDTSLDKIGQHLDTIWGHFVKKITKTWGTLNHPSPNLWWKKKYGGGSPSCPQSNKTFLIKIGTGLDTLWRTCVRASKLLKITPHVYPSSVCSRGPFNFRCLFRYLNVVRFCSKVSCFFGGT